MNITLFAHSSKEVIPKIRANMQNLFSFVFFSVEFPLNFEISRIAVKQRFRCGDQIVLSELFGGYDILPRIAELDNF